MKNLDDVNGAVARTDFRFTDEYGNRYTACSDIPYFEDIDMNMLEEIGRQFVNFLRQIGYVMRGDYLLTKGLTESELEAVEDFLRDLRHENRPAKGEEVPV